MTEAKAGTKKDRVVALVRANKGVSRKEMISKIMETEGMTEAGASTYFYNAQKTIKTEDALAGATAKKDEVVSEGSPEKPKGGKKKEKDQTVSEETAKATASAERRTGADINSNSQEMDEFLNSIDVDGVPEFLRKGWAKI